MRIQIVRLTEALPEDFGCLRKEAVTEGWGHMDRLAAGWAEGPPAVQDGEALMAAFVDGDFAGIGALTVEPAEPGVFRMRRFYVRQSFRGAGVGRALASVLMHEGLSRFPSLTVHAREKGARAFWMAMGFRLDERSGWSHRYGP